MTTYLKPAAMLLLLFTVADRSGLSGGGDRPSAIDVCRRGQRQLA